LADFDRIEQLGAVRRKIYEANYRNLRHKWFAHRGVSGPKEIEELFSATNIEELNQLFEFLGLLYLQLWQLFVNGREPNFDEPFSGMPGDVAVHVIQEAERFLKKASGVPAH
jgi:AbiU2